MESGRHSIIEVQRAAWCEKHATLAQAFGPEGEAILVGALLQELYKRGLVTDADDIVTVLKSLTDCWACYVGDTILFEICKIIVSETKH